jgi:hypothetical protein
MVTSGPKRKKITASRVIVRATSDRHRHDTMPAFGAVSPAPSVPCVFRDHAHNRQPGGVGPFEFAGELERTRLRSDPGRGVTTSAMTPCLYDRWTFAPRVDPSVARVRLRPRSSGVRLTSVYPASDCTERGNSPLDSGLADRRFRSPCHDTARAQQNPVERQWQTGGRPGASARPGTSLTRPSRMRRCASWHAPGGLGTWLAGSPMLNVSVADGSNPGSIARAQLDTKASHHQARTR